MPVLEIGTGLQTATTTVFQTMRQLIPGLQPGGSRVGQPMKPALLILDAWAEILNGSILDANTFNQFRIDLRLSQEQTGIPGLILPVASWTSQQAEATAVGRYAADLPLRQVFKNQGTIWAAKYVGVQLIEVGTATIDVSVFVEYEQILIPFMEWFVKWDFLDHVIDNTKDF